LKTEGKARGQMQLRQQGGQTSNVI